MAWRSRSKALVGAGDDAWAWGEVEARGRAWAAEAPVSRAAAIRMARIGCPFLCRRASRLWVMAVHRRMFSETPTLRPGWVKASSVAGLAPTAGRFRPRTSLHQAYFSSKTLKTPARRVARSVTFQKAVT